METFSSSSSSFQHHTILHDHLSQFYQLSGDVVNQNIDQSINVNDLGVNSNEGFVYYNVTANKNSMDSSSTVTDINNYNYINNKYVDSCSIQITPKKVTTTLDKKGKTNEGSSSPNCAQSKEKKQKKVKDGEETERKSKEEKRPQDNQVPADYIYVRARRGQATDSHSLAERVRREKISERMKLLQSLVPGCEKVTGKALMLDEIINYVQSLQNQVEFLSMTIASINPMFYDFGMDFESLMVRPDQELNSLPSPLPASMQTSSPTLTANHYPIYMDNSANSLLFQHAHNSNSLPAEQGHGQVLWEVDDQTQKIMNQTNISPTSF